MNKILLQNFNKTIMFLFCLQYILVFFQIPEILIDVAFNRSLNDIAVKIGYTLCIGSLFGLFIPLLILFGFLFGDLIKSKQILISWKGILINISLITAVLNFLYGFFFVPFYLGTSNELKALLINM